MMTEHIIAISRDEKFLARLAKYREPDEQDRKDAWQAHIECTVRGGCGGWEECREPHTSPDGLVDANDGPYDTVCSCAESESTTCSPPWCGCDEFEFHGVWHEWRWGYGWTVPFEGCVLASNHDFEIPDGIDTTRDARWRVEDDWDDIDCYLTLIGEAGLDEEGDTDD